MSAKTAIIAVLSGLGAMGAVYACIELLRIIGYYYQVVGWIQPFWFEITFVVMGIIWILIAVFDDLFLKRDLFAIKRLVRYIRCRRARK